MGIQVSSLTQGKKPWQKEFIDFQFNGKNISEFGLVAVFDSDRHTFAASPSFDNETTEVNGAVGQLFWGSRIKSLKRTYALATDGMTEAQVNEFKQHFRPGQYGKFIEDKLMHRYGYCRVAEVIEFKMVPFQKTINFLGFPLVINEYKGELSITFEWDTPYMYSLYNYIKEDDAPTIDTFNDVARAVYNNGIPLYSSWTNCFINAAPKSSSFSYGADLGRAILGTMFLGMSSNDIRYQCHLGQDKCLEFIQTENAMESVLVNDFGYQGKSKYEPLIYYNPSNIFTPAKIILNFMPSFTQINITNWEPVYINSIADDINAEKSGYTIKYNTVIGTQKLIGTVDTDKINRFVIPELDSYTYEFKYTNPNVLYSLNKGIKLAYDFYKTGEKSALKLEERLREEIVHKNISKHFIQVLSTIRSDSTYCDRYDNFTNGTKSISLTDFGESASINGDWFVEFNILALKFLYEDNEGFKPFSLVFDGEKSESKIKYGCKILQENFQELEEFCGDSILSPYFNLEGGDSVDIIGNILSCHALLFSRGGNFNESPHVTLEYKYTYL